MKIPKCEIALPKGYRWVKKGEAMKTTDLVYRSLHGELDWIAVNTAAILFKACHKSKIVIRKK